MNERNIIINAVCGTNLDSGLSQFKQEDAQFFVEKAIRQHLPIDKIDPKYLPRIADIIALGVEYLATHRPHFQKTGLVLIDSHDPVHVKAGYVASIIAAYIEVNEFYDLIEWIESDEFDPIEDSPFNLGTGASGYGEDAIQEKGFSLLGLNDIADLIQFLDAGIAHFRVLSAAMRQTVPQLAIKKSNVSRRDYDGDDIDLYSPDSMSKAASRGKGLVDLTTVGIEQFERKYKNEAYQIVDLADEERVPSREIVVLDTSQSMDADYRSVRATVVLYDRLQAVIDGDAEVICIFFAGQPQLMYLSSGEYIIDTPEKAKQAMSEFVQKYQRSSGRSTNIPAAINYAVEIATKDDNRVDGEPPNILFITDEAGFYGRTANAKGCIINGVVAEDNPALKRFVLKTGGEYVQINRIPVKIAL